MKKILIFAALATTLFCACEKDENVESNIDKVVVDENITNNEKRPNDDNAVEEENQEEDQQGKEDNKNDDTEYIIGDGAVEKSFIQQYFHVDYLKIVAKTYEGKLLLEIRNDGDYLRSTKDVDRLSSAIGDTCFNKKIPPYINQVVCDTLISISITADEDYDNDHPAGKPLNDIAKFYYESPISFIKSGYLKNDDGVIDSFVQDYLGGVDYYYTMSRIDVDSISDISFFTSFTYIAIDHLPANKGQYAFTVKMKFSDKEVVKKEVFGF